MAKCKIEIETPTSSTKNRDAGTLNQDYERLSDNLRQSAFYSSRFFVAPYDLFFKICQILNTTLARIRSFLKANQDGTGTGDDRDKKS